jgi:hypothetical protein
MDESSRLVGTVVGWWAVHRKEDKVGTRSRGGVTCANQVADIIVRGLIYGVHLTHTFRASIELLGYHAVHVQ